MALPNVMFKYAKSALGGVNPSIDGVCGLVVQVPVAPTNLPLGEVKCLYTLLDAEDLGLDEDFDTTNKCVAWGEISDFFNKTNGKGELWIILVSDTTSMADICDKTKDVAKKLLIQSDGRIAMWGVAVNRAESYAPTIADGLDADVWAAADNAQELRQTMALDRYMPTRVILPGVGFDGAISALKDLTQGTNNGVQISLHGRKESTTGRVGFMLGWKAMLSVQRNAGRVLNGDLKVSEAYLTDGVTQAKDLLEYQDVMNDKGYIFPIVRFRRSGFFYNDDKTATSLTDDYSSFTNGRVIDKVQRIAYDVYTDYINDDFALSRDGKIGADALKNLQGDIQDAVNTVMTSNGEISGFQCYVDPNQDTIAAGKTQISLRVQPRGYHKIIEVELGFTKTIN